MKLQVALNTINFALTFTFNCPIILLVQLRLTAFFNIDLDELSWLTCKSTLNGKVDSIGAQVIIFDPQIISCLIIESETWFFAWYHINSIFNFLLDHFSIYVFLPRVNVLRNFQINVLIKIFNDLRILLAEHVHDFDAEIEISFIQVISSEVSR